MNAVSVLEGQVQQLLANLGMGVATEGMVVAVSGGPDSVALLRALLASRPAGAGPLTIAHLDHGLRGDASAADAAFVADLHARLAPSAGVPLKLAQQRVDIASLAEAEQGNTEAVARRVRYAWLAEVAQQTGARWVATGHTASDQAETVLHHILRGTGLHGLRGIAASRDLAPGIDLVRPLLQTTRAQVLAYLAALGQESRQDATNDDVRFTRNRLRHDLLPQLAREYNPGIDMALCRLAEQAAEALRLEEAAVRELLGTAERPPAGSLRIFDAEVLACAPRALVRSLFRFVWEREQWPSGRLGFEDWDRLAELATRTQGGFDLADGMHARRRGGVVQVGPAPRALPKPLQ